MSAVTILRGRHVIITGGSEGIGLAAAKVALSRGAKVSLIARRADVLEQAATTLGDSTSWAAADVSDAEGLQSAVDTLCDNNGPCDVLLTSAGYARPGYFHELPIDDFRQEMEVNYLGTVFAVRAVIESMIERHAGHVVVVSSVAGLLGVYGYTSYSPTKFAVRGFAEALRAEVHPFGIKTSIVYPPDTETPGLDRENFTKPAETVMISGTISPRPADVVAEAIISGIERNKLTITADAATAVLARGSGVLGPVLRQLIDRDVSSVQKSGRGDPLVAAPSTLRSGGSPS